MSDWITEIGVASQMRTPIPFEEAWKRNNDNTKFVLVFPTFLLADIAFSKYRNLFPPSLLKRVRKYSIIFTNDAELMFITEGMIEKGNALRGLGKVVWCV
jgi:hypothetical protein